MTKLTGHDAIEAKRENSEVVLNTYDSPIDSAQEDITIEQAEEIAREDDSLVWAEVQEFKVISTEIYDNANKREDGTIQPSEISVGVTVEVKDKTYFLDYQTTSTHDYGAYSSNLASYDGSGDHIELAESIDDEEKMDKLLEQIGEKAGVNKLWQEYMDSNYNIDADHYGGMDANSEVNSATLK